MSGPDPGSDTLTQCHPAANDEHGPGVEDLFRFLVLHAEEHFAAEDRLMQESQHPVAPAAGRGEGGGRGST